MNLTFDALVNEVDVSKMCVFFSDVTFGKEQDSKGRRISTPFGRGDCAVFREVMSTENLIQELAPVLRTEAQAFAVWQSL